MKKSLSVVLIIIMFVSGLFIFSGCGNKTTEVNKTKNEAQSRGEQDSIVGSYTIFEAYQYGQTFDAAALRKEHMNYGIDVRADGTATVHWSEKEEEFTYDETYFTSKKDGTKVKYTYGNGVIKLMDDEGFSMSFEKNK